MRNLKAAIALLPDFPTQNRIRRLTLRLDDEFGTGLAAGILPPHVSLKQPFEVRDLGRLDRYFDEWASSLSPRSAMLGVLRVWPKGVAYLTVDDDALLRPLHERLVRELPEALGHPTPAEFDDEYVFHLTVAFGGPGRYEEIEAAYRNVRMDWACTLDALALFVYREADLGWEYIHYRTISLHS